MTNREKFKPILLFCFASVGVAIVVAIVSNAFDGPAEEVNSSSARELARETTTRSATPPAQVPPAEAEDNDSRNYLEEFSVDLANQDGEKIGTVRVRPTSQGVEFNIFARKLWPGPHSVHLYEHGVCEGPDFLSAGGHFNPTNATHGTPDYDTDPGEQDHHIGDMPGDRANSQGQLNHRATNASVTFGPTIGGRYSIADEDGTSLVITQGSDAGATPPSSPELPRVACAVITQPRVDSSENDKKT